MGQSKTGGYVQLPSFTPGQNTTLDQILQFAQQNLGGQGIAKDPLYQQATNATASFLPGGSGGNPIAAQAHRNFREQTLPEILNGYGSNNKGSSSLNQALAHAGENLNTNLAADQSRMALQASNQLSNQVNQPYQLGLNASQQGLSAQPFAFSPEQQPFWQSMILALTEVAGKVASAKLGAK